ncbi:nitroreductase [Solidesulfovibrio carbinoliphilus subsp. oakridgensis]|uniref:Nitroreductase n=1 Tax=Solidesulfovibrio carbinoliphilus subsp. oakridgensis TaxID=694327 RepID=G7QAY3_9BACT|nr:nitroreductase family protein [Solidesulfovibrio carbinoliphilus]EHJ48324.1 nitroreductase [Solidesulfovibrio carbinoliphilus subsp. oakridgensis]
MERNLVKLNSPSLRSQAGLFSEYKYDVKSVEYLEHVKRTDVVNIFDLCSTRATERIFYKTSRVDISLLFWYSFKSICTRKEFDITIKHKAFPSAGGRHSIDVLYITHHNNRWNCFLYDDCAHALCLLDINNRQILNFIHKISSVLDPQFGDIIWFVSQDLKLSSKYENAESLIWRDAGVALGHLAFVAEAIGLNFCPLGITGDNEIRELLCIPESLSPVGGCIVGRKGPYEK